MAIKRKLCKTAEVMRNHAHIGWDDLKFVLAVAEKGSVAAAARALSVNHATVLRRIAAFESRQGIRLFDKTSRGYQVSPDRRALIEAMQSASEALSGVDRMIDAERPRLGQGLRITSTDTIACLVLTSILPALVRETGTQIDLSATNTYADFGRMEAHITVRPTLSLPDDLTGEQVGHLWFGVYASSPDVSETLGHSGPLVRTKAATWWRNEVGECDVTADSFLTLAALAADAKGKTVLPTFVGETWPGLVRLGLIKEVPLVPVWVASHVDFARSGRLVKARRIIGEHLRQKATFSEPKADG